MASKDWIEFVSPMYSEFDSDTRQTTNDGEFEFQLQIWSSLYPEYRIRSHSEAYYSLKKCSGIKSNAVHNFDIDGIEYRRVKLIIGIGTGRILEAGFSGSSTRAGEFCIVFLNITAMEGLMQDNGCKIKKAHLHIYNLILII